MDHINWISTIRFGPARCQPICRIELRKSGNKYSEHADDICRHGSVNNHIFTDVEVCQENRARSSKSGNKTIAAASIAEVTYPLSDSNQREVGGRSYQKCVINP